MLLLVLLLVWVAQEVVAAVGWLVARVVAITLTTLVLDRIFSIESVCMMSSLSILYVALRHLLFSQRKAFILLEKVNFPCILHAYLRC